MAFETQAKLTKRDEPGSFGFTQVPSGRVVLEIKGGNRRQWSEVVVQPGQATNVTLTLQPPCVFQGTALFTPPGGPPVFFPATAPKLNQTVVVCPEG